MAIKRIVFDRDNDGKSKFANQEKGVYYTSSTGGTATGLHSDFIFNDDPLSAKQANSLLKRNSANDYISTTLSSRKTDKSRTVTITVMQRLHLDDPSGYLLAKKKLQHICLPARVTADNRHLVQPQSALPYYEHLPIEPGQTVEIFEIKGATAYVHTVGTLEP